MIGESSPGDEPGEQPQHDGLDGHWVRVYGAAHLLVSATWTTVEVTSALTRAAKVGRGDLDTLLGMLAEDTETTVP